VTKSYWLKRKWGKMNGLLSYRCMFGVLCLACLAVPALANEVDIYPINDVKLQPPVGTVVEYVPPVNSQSSTAPYVLALGVDWAWPDGYNSDGQGTGFSSAGYSLSGNAPRVSGDDSIKGSAWGLQYDMSGVTYRTFGVGYAALKGSMNDPNVSATLLNPGGMNPTYGTTVILVTKTDDGHTLVNCPGATVTIFNPNGAAYGKSWVLTARSNAVGQQMTWATFGLLANAGAVGPEMRPDQPYPSGLQRNSYTVTVSCPGYKTYQEQRLGSAWVGSGSNVALVNTSLAAVSTGGSLPAGGSPAPVLPTDPAATTLPPATATTNPSGGTAGGAWYDNFWTAFQNAMVALFVPKRSDLDQIVADWQAICSWGPFGLWSQLLAQYTFAAGIAASGPDTDPNYWVFPLTIGGYFAPSTGAPTGYTGPPAASAYTPNIFDVGMPKTMNLAPFAPFLVFGRGCMLVLMWCSFGAAIIRRLMPVIRI
jgi:hypothetical protein